MTKKRIRRSILKSLCGKIGPGDGDDPRLESHGRTTGQGGRKSRQLCAQAGEALSFALAALPDEVLSGLTVQSVEPGGDASRLIATLLVPRHEPTDPAILLERLERASGRLRSEVARSITRRKTPTIAFRLAFG